MVSTRSERERGLAGPASQDSPSIKTQSYIHINIQTSSNIDPNKESNNNIHNNMSRQAIQASAAGVVALNTLPIPEPGHGQFLVKTAAVAINPTDWKAVANGGTALETQTIIGCDYAGTIIKLGPGVTRFKVGDHVAGFAFGNYKDSQNGAFATHVLGSNLAVHIPPSTSFLPASTLGVAITTIGQSFYHRDFLNLPLPGTPSIAPYWLLILGGASAMGTMAIQFAKLSGAKVIATSSPKNFELVKSYGADEVLDRDDTELVLKIKKITKGELKLCFDTIGLKDSLALESGHFHTLMPNSVGDRAGVKYTWSLAYTGFGEALEPAKGWKIAAASYDKQQAEQMWELTDGLFAEGKIRAHPILEIDGGLEGLKNELMSIGSKVSGQKAVVKIAE